MRDILRKINRIDGVRGVVVTDPDGLVVAAELSEGDDPSAIGATAAHMYATLKQAATRLERGTLSRFTLRGKSGNVVGVLMKKVVLVTLVRRDANMGMVLVELKDLVTELEAALC